MWTFERNSWLTVVRIPLGARLETDLRNSLPHDGEHASIHWHGIRLPNDQDGVPYLVQDPVFPGESYHYSFVPPDTGTFFFHTHCNTAEHFGRGLVGVLIVEGDETEPYDADEVLLIRDWRVDVATGEFLSFTTRRGAARAGTYGPVRSVNGVVNPEISLPARADCRLRLINVDPTRIVDVGVTGADAAIIAIDGIPVAPFQLEHWALAPAMRIDVVVRTPREGGRALLIDHRPEEPFELARLTPAGESKRSGDFVPAPLRASVVPEPVLDDAGIFELEFGSVRSADELDPEDPLFDLLLGPLCLGFDTNWTINASAWPAGDHENVPQPLAELKLGGSYRFILRNRTQLVHPIHIHGHSFKVLASGKRRIIPHFADTVLLGSDETIEAAFVADNPGRWMVHCHVAEHQETGMMGYFTVG
jgi:FtsP/CotA-like multicopper oxidase with cupredoxin domain